MFDVRDLTVNYGSTTAISGVNLEIYRNLITAMIGPSGCGKSTFIRCLNRMNDLFPGAKVDGQVLYHGQDIYGDGVDPVEVRRRIGMVFQQPNPFPKSIYDNVAWGPRVIGMKKGLDERVEKALRSAALWDEVKDRLKRSALSLSGGQQQRLCIARAIAIEPDVVLLDEPASALDPIATSAIEDLMHDLKREYTIVIVTHNMQQAARVADMTAFFSLEVDAGPPQRSAGRVRLDRQRVHEPVRQPYRGLRHGAVRMRTTFQEDLDLLETTLQEEGALVLRALRGALNALEQRDHELADEVIAFDDDVDDRYIRIEEGVQKLLARQTPVASDLRLVLAILHINLHLERMADYCVTIAKLSKLVPDVEPSPRFVEGFEEMGSRCEEMIRIALDSFEDRDLARAESLVDLDELVDRANRRVVGRILELGEAAAMREYGLRMVLVSRALERIGDHAVDIGEQVAYLLTAEFREFTDASHKTAGEV